MVKDIVDSIKKAEFSAEDKVNLALKEKQSLIQTTKEQVQKLFEYAEADRKKARDEILGKIDMENENLLKSALEEGKKTCENLESSVSDKKEKLIDEIIGTIF